MQTDPALLLASASPRRHALLHTLGVSFAVQPADIDETPFADEAPRDYVARMAREKAAAVAAVATLPVLAADTSVVLGGTILGKPAGPAQALHMLRQLSGNVHRVYTALCLHPAGTDRPPAEQLVCTEVSFAVLSEAECIAYIATGEPRDKAGGYAIQGLGGALVDGIRGSYSNVVGLPLCQTRALLRAHGIPTALDTCAAEYAAAREERGCWAEERW